MAAIPAARAADDAAADRVAANRVAATPVSAPGTTLYVDFNGPCDDSGPGTAAEPFCTVQAAANVVDPGQTVSIAAASATEDPQSVSITRSGTPGEPITFAWTGIGTDPVLSPEKQTGKAVVTLEDVHDVTLSRLTIESWDTDDAIDVIGSSDISLANLDLIHRVTSDMVQPASADVMIDGASSDVTVARTNFQSGTPLEEVLAKPGAQQVTLADNLLYAGGAISGFTLDGTTDADVTNNTLLLDCSSSKIARTLVTMADGSSGSVENNILEPLGATCTSPTVGLSVDASSAGRITADYDAFFPEGTAADYSWAGTSYSDPAAFAAATGQGTHDITLASAIDEVLPEGSPAINSGNCSAPGVPSTDFQGDPWVRDPLATDADLGNGSCHVSRGAYARQDSLPFTSTAPPANSAGYPAGAVPFSTGLTVTGDATSPWGEPVSYTVNFGDGSAPATATPGVALTHTYTTAGEYTITLTGADTSGSTSTGTAGPVYALPDQGPTAGLSAAPVGLGSSLGIDPDTAGFTSSDGGVPAWEIGTSRTIYVPGQASVAVDPDGTWDYTYAEPGSYTTTLTVTDKLGRTATAEAAITVGDEPQDVYPTTYYDHSVPAHGLVKIPLANLEDCCARGALVDVRVTDDPKGGYVVVYPDGTTRPDLSTVQFQAGRAAENSALAIGGSTTDFYNGSAGSINLQIVRYGLDTIMDTYGGSYGETYAPVTPVTVLPRTEVAGGHQVTFPVADLHGVPADALDVVLDVTASGGATAGSFATYGSSGWGLVGANTDGYWAKGQQVTGLDMVPISGGKVVLENAGAGAAYFAAQVVGYYLNVGSDAVFLPATPRRIDAVTIAANSSVALTVAGKNGIPATGTTAVAVDLTTTAAATASGTVAAYADGTALPFLISLSYARGVSVANASIVAVGTDGAIRLYNAGSKPVTVYVDLTGSYYAYP